MIFLNWFARTEEKYKDLRTAGFAKNETKVFLNIKYECQQLNHDT
jgi:hypothetical protein